MLPQFPTSIQLRTSTSLSACSGRSAVTPMVATRQSPDKFSDCSSTSESNRRTPWFVIASQKGHVEVVRLLLAHPDVEANRTSTDGRSALCFASQSGHGAIVSLLVAHRAHGQVRLLAADAIDSLPAVLFKELPGFTAQAAALLLPLDVAAALGDTEEERAAADVLASQSASFEAAKAQLASAAVQSPQELARAREALARAPAQSPSDAAASSAREREA